MYPPNRLTAILAKGSTQDGKIAIYFERIRHSKAVAALEKALGRHEPDSFEARHIRRAMEFQRRDE